MGKRIIFLACIACITSHVAAADSLPRFNMKNMIYEGAYRFSGETYGTSRLGYENGTIAIDSQNSRLFIIGHAQHQNIAEFTLPDPSMASELGKVPIIKQPSQNFVSLIKRVPGDNSDSLDTITGLAIIDNKLIVNAAQFYDADANNSDTTFIIDNPNDLAGSSLSSFLKLDSGYHSAGWITPIPPAYKEKLGGDYVFGNASNLSINGRSSMGPSAFIVDKDDIFDEDENITTQAILDYSIQHQLHEDHYNKTGTNDVWTEVSTARVGFIIPGTRTYAVFGTSGGHKSGIGYKITQDNGYSCGGGCPFVAADIYNYYWLWDVDELLEVKKGHVNPYEVVPYEKGELSLEFDDTDSNGIKSMMVGAAFDYKTASVYFVLKGADRLQSQYEAKPVMLQYKLEVNPPKPPEVSD